MTSTCHGAYDQERPDAENDASLNHAGCANPTAIETSSNHWESENGTNGGNPVNPWSHATHWTHAWNDGSHGSSLTPNGYGHYEEYHCARNRDRHVECAA